MMYFDVKIIATSCAFDPTLGDPAMRKHLFRTHQQHPDEFDFEDDLYGLERFDKRHHTRQHSDDIDGHHNRRRAHKDQRRPGATAQRY
jgi:hypothetical protein